MNRRATAPKAPSRPAIGEERLGTRDQLERRGLALLAGVAPADHAVPAEHCAARVGDAALEVAEREPELEARAPPGQPADVVAVALGDERLAVVGGGERDHRVGMEMVDVVLGDEGVQRRVDRRHRAAVAEAAVRVEADDVVLVHARGVHALERAHPVEHEEGEPGTVSVPRSPPEPLTASTGSALR